MDDLGYFQVRKAHDRERASKTSFFHILFVSFRVWRIPALPPKAAVDESTFTVIEWLFICIQW